MGNASSSVDGERGHHTARKPGRENTVVPVLLLLLPLEIHLHIASVPNPTTALKRSMHFLLFNSYLSV